MQSEDEQSLPFFNVVSKLKFFAWERPLKVNRDGKTLKQIIKNNVNYKLFLLLQALPSFSLIKKFWFNFLIYSIPLPCAKSPSVTVSSGGNNE